MKKLLILFLTIILSFSLKAQDVVNGTNFFDFGWRFHKGGSLGAENPSFKDSLWRKVDLPHDWSIEDLPGTNSRFNPDAISQVNGGYTTGRTDWYRKNFVISGGQSKKRILIQFDGIYMNADVYINGRNVGNHPYGYTSFWYDVTDRIKFGQDNIIAVKVRNEGENSRWYSGSGIYRHVWLKVLDPVYVENWGVSITTPEVTSASARVNISTIVNNKSDSTLKVNLVSSVLSPKGVEIVKSVSEQTIEKAGSFEFKQDLILPKPDLWSPESPSLYIAVNEVYSGGKLVDRVETKFGVRTLSFDVTNGFQLNGKTVKLKGGSFHHDNGLLGSRSYDRAEERRVELLKANGFNAVRCSHNPPAPAFLDACDRLGMLVLDETRILSSSAEYLGQFERLILRDRNHPSVIAWSIGNEEPIQVNDNVRRIALAMMRLQK